MGIIDIDNKYVAHSYGRYPVCITHGKGSVVYDENNKTYSKLILPIKQTFNYSLSHNKY